MKKYNLKDFIVDLSISMGFAILITVAVYVAVLQ